MSSSEPRAGAWRPWVLGVLACAAGLIAGLFRFLALTGFPNDQFEHLAGAQQMLAGEWPTVDFFDPGMPLTYGASALSQLLLGQSLFAEAVLNACAYGVVAACSMLVAARLSRSIWVGLAAAVLVTFAFPRMYAYPKLLMTALAPLSILAWVARPDSRRLAMMALTLVVAFLYRHDYAAYVGMAMGLALLLTPAETLRHRIARAMLFSAVVLALLLPYALSIGGVDAFVESLRSFVEYGRRHSSRTVVPLDDIGWDPEGRMFVVFHALPVVALVITLVDHVRRRTADVPVIVPICAMAVMSNVLLMRDPLSARLADAVVPPVLVAAWLAGRLVRTRPAAARAAVVVALIGLGGMMSRDLYAVGGVAEQFNRTAISLSEPEEIPGLIAARTAELKERYGRRQAPDGRVLALVPFFDYLERCTTTRHRLLVGGYAPEIYVYAHRLFGGGQKVFLDGSYASPADQQKIVSKMERQVVLFVLLLTDMLPQWQDFSIVHDYVEAHFKPLVDIQASSERVYRVLIHPGLPALSIDRATGWPCYR